MQNTELKHTPGPWKLWEVTIPFKGWEIIDANNHGVCRTPSTRPQDASNARLIACAPELLAALQVAAEHLDTIYAMGEPDDVNDNDRAVLANAKAAIAKAIGQ